MASIDFNRIARITRRTARILASLVSFVFTYIVIASTIEGNSYSYFALEIPMMLWLVLAITLGMLLTRWNDLPAGIFMATLSAIVGAMANFNCWLLFGTPFLAAGILFILAWLLEILHQRSLKEAKPL